MDIQDIDKMPAGEELDALVAENVMGGKWIRFHDADYPDPDTEDGRVHATIVLPKDFDFLCPPEYVEDTGECPRTRYSWIPRYSTDIAAAWEVIDKLDELYSAWFEIRGPRVWLAQCHLPNYKQFSATGVASAPLAICRAALKAIKGDNDE